MQQMNFIPGMGVKATSGQEITQPIMDKLNNPSAAEIEMVSLQKSMEEDDNTD